MKLKNTNDSKLNSVGNLKKYIFVTWSLDCEYLCRFIFLQNKIWNIYD